MDLHAITWNHMHLHGFTCNNMNSHGTYATHATHVPNAPHALHATHVPNASHALHATHATHATHGCSKIDRQFFLACQRFLKHFTWLSWNSHFTYYFCSISRIVFMYFAIFLEEC